MALLIKAITFDFDGVIVADSEYIKEDSWEVVVRVLGEISREPIIAARQAFSKGRGSRYDIIAATLSSLGYSEEKIPEFTNNLAEVYNEEVQRGILRKGVRPIDRRGLSELALSYPLYINSATPESAVAESVKKLGLAEFFSGVFGQPSKKKENLCRAIVAEQIQPAEMLFIGDGDGDYQAAIELGMPFIGLANSWNEWQNPKPFPLIADLTEIANILTNW